jgi:hypothetical protein
LHVDAADRDIRGFSSMTCGKNASVCVMDRIAASQATQHKAASSGASFNEQSAVINARMRRATSGLNAMTARSSQVAQRYRCRSMW